MLRQLSLTGHTITQGAMQSLGELAGLEFLELLACVFDGVPDLRPLERCARLATLTLYQCVAILPSTSECMPPLPSLTNLQFSGSAVASPMSKRVPLFKLSPENLHGMPNLTTLQMHQLCMESRTDFDE